MITRTSLLLLTSLMLSCGGDAPRSDANIVIRPPITEKECLYYESELANNVSVIFFSETTVVGADRIETEDLPEPLGDSSNFNCAAAFINLAATLPELNLEKKYLYRYVKANTSGMDYNELLGENNDKNLVFSINKYFIDLLKQD